MYRLVCLGTKLSCPSPQEAFSCPRFGKASLCCLGILGHDPGCPPLCCRGLTGTCHSSLELYAPQRADLGCYCTFSSWKK
uniref:Uncharacterized protein n=1 Tax=Mustela putorius furo TaxID=9669 RepID=M3YBV5_MUSPF